MRMRTIIVMISISLISFAMHFSHFSKDLVSMHVWRQAQTQSTILNFYEEDFNILNPSRNERGKGKGIFRMEFPLMQWMVAGLYKIAGNHLFICRLFMFIIGLFSVWGIYKLLWSIFQNNTLALFGAWAFNFSPSFYYYTINPIPDNLAMCFAIWGVALFFTWTIKKEKYLLLISGLLLSAASLCKLPFILYYTVPLTYLILDFIKKRDRKTILANAFLVVGFIPLPCIWYFSVIPHWHGNGIVHGILTNKMTLTLFLDYLHHNLISTLPELLINYGSLLFFLSGLYFLFKYRSYTHSLFPVFVIWLLAISAYFIFEINMIGKIHDYYLFPFYPLIFIIVSYGAYNMFVYKNKYSRHLTIFLLLILPLTAYIRMHKRWDLNSPGFNKDLLVFKDELRNAVPKNALCIAGNDGSHFIFFYYIDKKGWGFQEDTVNMQDFAKMIDEGAEYMYSDSRKVDTNPQIIPFLDSLIVEKGSVKVYHLKKNDLKL